MTRLEIIKQLGYEKPTPIQAQAIPAIMSGRDVLGVAKTGSGKTIAYLLPMFRHLMDQRPLGPMEGPIAVIMTPTRELALQVVTECKKFCQALGYRVSCNMEQTHRGREMNESHTLCEPSFLFVSFVCFPRFMPLL